MYSPSILSILLDVFTHFHNFLMYERLHNNITPSTLLPRQYLLPFSSPSSPLTNPPILTSLLLPPFTSYLPANTYFPSPPL